MPVSSQSYLWGQSHALREGRGASLACGNAVGPGDRASWRAACQTVRDRVDNAAERASAGGWHTRAHLLETAVSHPMARVDAAMLEHLDALWDCEP